MVKAKVTCIQYKAGAMVKANVRLKAEKDAFDRARLEAYQDKLAKADAVIAQWQNEGLCGCNPYIVDGFKAAHALMRSLEWKETYADLHNGKTEEWAHANRGVERNRTRSAKP